MNTTSSKEVKVWDILIRIFHWTLVISFFTAYLTEDDFLDIHRYAGYLITGLLVFRLIWGFIGSRYARFSNFVYSFAAIKDYLKSLLTTHPKHYLGHNPAGGFMIILLLVSLSFTVSTGIVMDLEPEPGNAIQQQYTSEHDDDNDEYESATHEVMEEIHEFFANLTLLLVFIHIAGVIVSSKLHNENLVRAMITGKKIQKN